MMLGQNTVITIFFLLDLSGSVQLFIYSRNSEHVLQFGQQSRFQQKERKT